MPAGTSFGTAFVIRRAMFEDISGDTAQRVCGCILALAAWYHAMLLAGFLSVWGNVWGGHIRHMRHHTKKVVELCSLATVLVICATAIAPLHWRSWGRFYALKVFAVLFAFNTVGNLFAHHMLERVFGTAATAVLAVFLWRLADCVKPAAATEAELKSVGASTVAE